MKIKSKTKKELLYLTLALPSLLGLLVFFIVPFVYALYLAMIDNPLARNFVGFGNFTLTINNAAFRLAASNTLRFIALCVPINVALSLAIAMRLRNIPFKGLFSAVFMLPLVVPSGSIVHFWRSIFGLNGVINSLFFSAAPVNWISSGYALHIITLIFIWKNIGFNIILFQAGLSQIPREYYEVAAIEGAGRFRQIISVTLVHLMPTMFLVLLMSFIATFRSFREIYLLAGTHPHRSIYMLQHFMNNQFVALDYQRMASAAYILVALITALALGLLFLQRRVANYD